MPSLDIRQIKATTDPLERARLAGQALATMSGLQSELRATRQAAILELRAAGWTWGKIADNLGMARSRPKQIAEGRTDTRARPTEAVPDAAGSPANRARKATK